jgi:hypothetical protein
MHFERIETLTVTPSSGRHSRVILSTFVTRFAFALTVLCLGLPSRAVTSLLRNGGFENSSGWSLGSGISFDTQTFRSGRRALRAETATGATSEQLVYAAAPGQTFTASGWLRTRNLKPHDGGGYAFMAIYQYDSSARLVDFKDFAQKDGNGDWTFASYTFRVHPSAEYLSFRVGIHNATGTAWFDDLNLVTGDMAVPWKEPAQPAGKLAAYRAAILNQPGMPVQGFATPAAAFRRALTAEGVPLESLTAEQLADPAQFNADRFDMLIVPTGATFPLRARRALVSFLMRGGDLLCTGGYAFDDLVLREGGSWISYAQYLDAETARARDPARSRIANGGFEEGDRGWQADAPAQCRIVETRPFAGRRCAEVSADSEAQGARYGAVLPVEPGRTYLIGAHMRTQNVRGSGFAFMAVYQFNREGKLVAFRDFVQATGTRDWRRYDIRLTIAPDASKVVFYGGLYLAAGRMGFDEVTCAPMPLEERINAHYGEPGDALGVTPTQLTLFSPDQRMTGSGLVPAAGGPLAGDWRSPGAVNGYEATAQLRQNARWQPLLEARDAYGRFSGAAGALVSHFAGPFSGSRWALFGVTNRDIFAGAEGGRLLRQVVRLLKSGVVAESLTTDYALYRPGETAKIKLAVADKSRPNPAVRERRLMRARLEFRAPGGALLHAEDLTFDLPRGTRREVNPTWRVPPDAPDFVRVTVIVEPNPLSPFPVGEGGRGVRDVIETGFCVYNPRVMQSGPRLTYRDNAFELTTHDSRLTTRPLLFGTDTWGSMFLSRSHSSLTWYRDLAMMRDYGLHMYENLQYAPTGWKFTEAQWRQFDALIQLSQRFGLPYMAGLLIGQDVVVDDATLAQQAAMCREFAARYRNVPGLIYYLNGDFQLNLKDIPDIRRLWNDFLKNRYGTQEALRKSWGANTPAEPLGQIPVCDAAPGYPGVRGGQARDVAEFKSALMRRWIGALCTAIRQEDTVHPITSEYYQRPFGGIDLRTTMDSMDAANYGYFGAPRQDIAQLLATIKWNDMRRAGKTVNIGEFGVKTHDAWARERDPWGYQIGRTETEQRQLFWWVVHAALAFDVTKIQNWCWTDDPDGVFPWGIAWNNPLRPKPVLKLYRNLRVFSDRILREDHRAEVVMILNDRWRMGAPDNPGYTGLMNALECLLATGIPFDVVNLSEAGGLLENPPRVALCPLAYALSEEEAAALRQLAEKGCAVYLSGDPASDREANLAPNRLGALCGVRLVRTKTHPTGLPVPEVEPAGAERAANPAGLPLYRHRIGKGEVWYSPEPWEVLPGYDVFVQNPQVTVNAGVNLYLSLLPLAGVEPPVRVEAKTGVWHVMATPSGANRLITLFPRADVSAITYVTARAAREEMEFEVRPGWPCAVLLNADRQPLAATGGRALRVNGRQAAVGDSAWMLVSLEDRPLESSSALAATLTEGGKLWWRSDARDLSAWIVEWRGGQAAVVAPVPLARARDGWEAQAPPNELLLVCPKAQVSRRLKAMNRF